MWCDVWQNQRPETCNAMLCDRGAFQARVAATCSALNNKDVRVQISVYTNKYITRNVFVYIFVFVPGENSDKNPHTGTCLD